jgi:glycosyltransferase involved in cell wall biosynthesis
MYSALPVITTEIGAAPEVVSNECGRFTAKGDVAGLSAALRDLLSDESKRNRLARGGRDRARSLCDPAKSVERLYHTIMGQIG